MPYLNFALEVVALPDGKYIISVESSPVGEASVTVDTPFTPQQIKDILDIFGRRKRGISKQQEFQAARQFGQILFNFLIRNNDDINAAYFTSLDRAGSDGLRIRLSVEKAGALAELPWELLYDPNRDFLCLSRATPVVRYTQMLSIRPPAPVTMPLRVLVMISSPKDFPTLDVEGEWTRLLEATASLRQNRLIEFERLDKATLLELQRRLRTNIYHVFHYIGHSDFDEYGKQGVLVFENDDDETRAQLITGDALSRELAEESTLRLVVLNSCQSARRAQEPFGGIASSIVQRGIPAVVAMQFPISDAAAKAFSEEFYHSLAELLPIESAVSEGRRAIANRVQNAEWATPTLYIRSEDGVLFRPRGAEHIVIPEKTPPPPPKPDYRIPMIGAGVLVVLIIAVLAGIGLLGRRSEPTPTPSPTRSITATPSGSPNLVVSEFLPSPRTPPPGQIFRLIIRITNTGDADSGAFQWTWDDGAGRLDAQGGTVDNLKAGATQNITVIYSYGWWGEYKSVINLDRFNQVRESDEFDNRLEFTIMTARNRPFEIDFTRLPNNDPIEPPLPLAADAFRAWNLGFALNQPSDSSCTTAAFNLLNFNAENVWTADGATTPEECAEAPLVINLLRPVSNVQVEIIPKADGEAAIRFFSDIQGTQPLFELTRAVRADDIVQLGANDGEARSIRRVDIRLTAQPVNLTRLTLSPPI